MLHNKNAGQGFAGNTPSKALTVLFHTGFTRGFFYAAFSGLIERPDLLVLCSSSTLEAG